MSVATALIGLDWGTTSLRAWRLGADGAVLEGRDGGPGIMKVEGGAFEAALEAFCGDWLRAHPAARLIASGMIGSKQGWREAPYCPCPASVSALAAHTVEVPLAGGRALTVLPGVCFTDPATGVPDVMRGEETQIMGALPGRGAHIAVLPGTHSKWAWVQDGAIVSFATFMTGEVYAALLGHTILGRLMQADAPPDAAAFARGVAYGLEAPASLLSRLFSARTLGLFGTLDAARLPAYLSGLLIGTEIGGALAMRGRPQRVTLLGSAPLVALYRDALAAAGISGAEGPADCAVAGMARIAGTR